VTDQIDRIATLIQHLATEADRKAAIKKFQEVVDNWETPRDAREGPAEEVVRDLAYDLQFEHDDEELSVLLSEALAALRALRITPPDS